LWLCTLALEVANSLAILVVLLTAITDNFFTPTEVLDKGKVTEDDCHVCLVVRDFYFLHYQ